VFPVDEREKSLKFELEIFKDFKVSILKNSMKERD